MNYDPIRRPWFYGRISREEAEGYLLRDGMVTGKFLLRKRPTEPRSYALSLCCNTEVIHYHIQHHADGKYGIEDGPKFMNPVELIEYHRANKGGLMTALSVPCKRPVGVEPKVYTNVNLSELEAAAAAAMRELGIDEQNNVRKNNVRFEQFEQMMGMLLHEKQPWFHGQISRAEAETRLKKCGSKPGLFLVREKLEGPPGTYILCLCNAGITYHYRLDMDDGKLSIHSGPKFLNLMECIEYYLNRSDGLVCKLSTPCPSRSSKSRLPDVPKSGTQVTDGAGQSPVVGRSPVVARPSPAAARQSTGASRQITGGAAAAAVGRGQASIEKIYDHVAMKKSVGYANMFKDLRELDVKRLTFSEKLGQGHFGSVLRGVYKLSSGKRIEVAVKQLKTEGISQQKSEIEHEARIMMKLDHPNIVRMIGMCHQESMMLVMELAAEGPLHKYLRKHRSLSVRQILIMLVQVSDGMAYLDSMHFVHRDLAARNVLVVNADFVKISDFGMSRAMGVGNDYYKAQTAGRWPLKWYAPECIYFFRFTTKSDVWGYAVTTWEALTYGGKPYEGLQGQEVIQFIESNGRLAKPMHCPNNVYELMKWCWAFEPEDRPDFSTIKEKLSWIILDEFPQEQ